MKPYILYIVIAAACAYVLGVQTVLWTDRHQETSDSAYKAGFQACQEQF